MSQMVKKKSPISLKCILKLLNTSKWSQISSHIQIHDQYFKRLKNLKKNKSSWNMPILHEILRIRAERCDYVPKESEKTQKSKR